MAQPDADRTLVTARQLADQIRLHIAECGFKYGDTNISVAISSGLSSFEPGDGLQSVFQRTDRALCQAKSVRRNCCRVY
jgi:PleD family two-component response regulator